MKKDNIHKNLKFIGVVAKNPKNSLEILEILKSFGVEILAEKSLAKFLNLKGFSLAEISKKTDLVVSVGGDGTLIGVCREAPKMSVIGVYDGTLGFLTDIKISEFSEFFKNFMSGKYEVEKPLMLEISLIKGEKTIKETAFNDLVLTRTAVLSMGKVDAFLDDKYFNTYYGDGVIISSPVGSTAYNLSVGGSIIYPLSEVYAVTPIAAHSLTQRPLVLPKQRVISFKNSSDSKISVVIDGQNRYDMAKFDRIEVRLGETRANLIRCVNWDFFDTLKSKLHWGHNGGKA